MPPKRIKRLRKKIQEQTSEKQKEASLRRTKKKAKANKRRRKARKLKKKVTKPVSEAKGLAVDVKDLTKAQAEALATRVPGGSSGGSQVTRRSKSSISDEKSGSGSESDQLDERQQKILLAQQLRNQGLTTQQVATQVGMSRSWVSSNTTAVDASQTLEASDDLEQSGDSFLSGIQAMEDQIFGGDIDGGGEGEGGVDIDLSGLDDDLDNQLSGLDDQFGDID